MIHAQTPQLVTAPAVTPVTVAEAKAHLRVDHTDEDALITALVAAATAHLDGYGGILGRALVTQTWRQEWSDFPIGRGVRESRIIPLPIAPVLSKDAVTITYFPPTGDRATLDASLYYLVNRATGPAIELDDDKDWPDTDDRPDAVRVEWVCGYGAAAAVPAPIKSAILLMVGDLYENREQSIVGTIRTENPAVQALLAPFRRVGV